MSDGDGGRIDEPDEGRPERVGPAAERGSPALVRRVAADRRMVAARERIARAGDRVNASSVGHLKRRSRDLDLMNHALILASLVLTLVVPAVLTLSAVVSLGDSNGIVDHTIRRFGLSEHAANDLRSLFPNQGRVTSSTTVLGVIGTLFWALAWPAELARGYQSVWSLGDRGLRDFWRAGPWLLSFVGVLAVANGTARLASGVAGFVLASVVNLPVLFAWSWWSQHFLLANRIPWRTLLPGAIATAVGLWGLGLFLRIYLPDAIVTDFDKYGPIGVIFALFTWFISFAVVMLGGPLVGHVIATRRSAR